MKTMPQKMEISAENDVTGKMEGCEERGISQTVEMTKKAEASAEMKLSKKEESSPENETVKQKETSEETEITKKNDATAEQSIFKETTPEPAAIGQETISEKNVFEEEKSSEKCNISEKGEELQKSGLSQENITSKVSEVSEKNGISSKTEILVENKISLGNNDEKKEILAETKMVSKNLESEKAGTSDKVEVHEKKQICLRNETVEAGQSMEIAELKKNEVFEERKTLVDECKGTMESPKEALPLDREKNNNSVFVKSVPIQKETFLEMCAEKNDASLENQCKNSKVYTINECEENKKAIENKEFDEKGRIVEEIKLENKLPDETVPKGKDFDENLQLENKETSCIKMELDTKSMPNESIQLDKKEKVSENMAEKMDIAKRQAECDETEKACKKIKLMIDNNKIKYEAETCENISCEQKETDTKESHQERSSDKNRLTEERNIANKKLESLDKELSSSKVENEECEKKMEVTLKEVTDAEKKVTEEEMVSEKDIAIEKVDEEQSLTSKKIEKENIGNEKMELEKELLTDEMEVKHKKTEEAMDIEQDVTEKMESDKEENKKQSLTGKKMEKEEIKDEKVELEKDLLTDEMEAKCTKTDEVMDIEQDVTEKRESDKEENEKQSLTGKKIEKEEIKDEKVELEKDLLSDEMEAKCRKTDEVMDIEEDVTEKKESDEKENEKQNLSGKKIEKEEIKDEKVGFEKDLLTDEMEAKCRKTDEVMDIEQDVTEKKESDKEENEKQSLTGKKMEKDEIKDEKVELEKDLLTDEMEAKCSKTDDVMDIEQGVTEKKESDKEENEEQCLTGKKIEKEEIRGKKRELVKELLAEEIETKCRKTDEVMDIEQGVTEKKESDKEELVKNIESKTVKSYTFEKRKVHEDVSQKKDVFGRQLASEGKEKHKEPETCQGNDGLKKNEASEKKETSKADRFQPFSNFQKFADSFKKKSASSISSLKFDTAYKDWAKSYELDTSYTFEIASDNKETQSIHEQKLSEDIASDIRCREKLLIEKRKFDEKYIFGKLDEVATPPKKVAQKSVDQKKETAEKNKTAEQKESSEIKVLVSGDVQGNFKRFFARIAFVNERKGPFDYLFCVGNFFSEKKDDEWKDVLAGKVKAPIPTYILGPNEVDHKKYFIDGSSELAPNIIYLGKCGVLTGSSGLKVAYLSGIEQEHGTEKISECMFSQKTVSKLKSKLSDTVVDILLTSQWPNGVCKYAITLGISERRLEKHSSILIAELAKAIKPRYHFSALTGIYYERLPYRNHDVLLETPTPVTRFFGLGLALNNESVKWLYAFSVVPGSLYSDTKELAKVTGPVTACPYDGGHFKKQFYTMTDYSKKHDDSDKPDQSKKQIYGGVTQCWFCLANSAIQKHLLISVGEHCYLSLPKGGLVPDHVLIVPIRHSVSSIGLSAPVYEEIEKFKNVLVQYFDDRNKDVVIFERNYASPHFQLQVVPVPKLGPTAVQESLMTLADRYKLEFNELPHFTDIQQLVPRSKGFFYMEIISEKKSITKMLHIIGPKFPLQFGRMVLASPEILNVWDRVDWKACRETQSEEQEMAEDFRRSFHPYDFTN